MLAVLYSVDHGRSSDNPEQRGSSTAGEQLSAISSESAPQDPLQREKRDFYEANNLDPDARPNAVGAAPLVRFWIDRLFHDDPEVREEAAQKFEVACENIVLRAQASRSIPDGLRGKFETFPAAELPTGEELDSDTAFIRSMVTHNYDVASQRWGSGFSRIMDQPETLRLIGAFAERLGSEETEARARKVLNIFTLDQYTDRDANWWKVSFPQSKIAGLYEGLPLDEWRNRSE